jgi:hypothetical protein
MEPLNDDELNEFLRQWEAPRAPARLRPSNEPGHWWRWLVSGTIRTPVPVWLLAVVIVVLSIYWGISAQQAVKPGRTVTLADFEPVKQLQPRIIRSEYEGQ